MKYFVLLFLLIIVIIIYIKYNQQYNIYNYTKNNKYEWATIPIVNLDNYPETVSSTGNYIRQINDSPKMYYIKTFLTSDEIDHIITLTNNRFNRSMVDNKNYIVGEERTSFSSFLKKAETPVVAAIEQRAAEIANVDVNQLEPLQVLKYSNGQYYKPHFDFFDDDSVSLNTGGQRIKTIFVCLNKLNDYSSGGGTSFPVLNQKLVPNYPGDAFYWHNVDENGIEDHKTLHSGEPVHNETKYAMNIWIRENNFV